MKYCSRGANPKTKRVLHSRLKNNITAVKGGVVKQPKEESRRIINLPLPMMEDKQPPPPNTDDLVRLFDVLCHADSTVTQFYNRQLKKTNKNLNKKAYQLNFKKFGTPLAELKSMEPHYVLETLVPELLVNRSLVKECSGRKDQDEATIFENKSKQKGRVKIFINFGCIEESLIPIWRSKSKDFDYVKAGSNLSNDDLQLALKLVGKNIKNIGVILLLVFQFKTRMWLSKTTKAPDGDDDLANLEEAKQILSLLENVMTKHLSNANSVTRTCWTFASYADPGHDIYFHHSMRRYRENCRALYLKQLERWKDSTNITEDVKLERLFFFHAAVIMSGSQGCSDEDGIERLNLLISGKRTGSLSVCMPLRNSDFLEYVDFLEDLLKSTKSQGLDMLRVIAFLELAILCETVWKTELPSSYLDIMRVPQLAQKKARVTLNAIGIINGVGIDSHVKRFFTKVLGYGYSKDKLDALLDLLDTQTAANVNDNIAEIGQKLRNVKKKGKHWNHDQLWLAEVFDDLGSINEEMRDLCSHWLDVYEIVSLKAIN